MGDVAKVTDKKPMRKKQKDYLKILKKTAGLVSPACEKFNMNRMTHYRWMKEIEGFKEAVDDINESMIDFTEGKLFNLIKEEEPSAVYFFLKCKAKNRGYVENQKIEHSGGLSINVNWGNDEGQSK